MVHPYVILSIGHVSSLLSIPSPSPPRNPPPRLWTPYHTSVAVPSPSDPYILSFLPPSLVAYPAHTRSRLVASCPFPIAVCSNPVAPFIMVSDPMDAPHGTDAYCVIKSPLFLFWRRGCRVRCAPLIGIGRERLAFGGRSERHVSSEPCFAQVKGPALSCGYAT